MKFSRQGSQLLVPSATNMQTQGVPRFNDSMSWMGSKHIKTVCFQALRVEDPWVVVYQSSLVKLNFWSPRQDTDWCFHESRWHSGTLFPSETTNLPYRNVSEVFYYGIRTVCRALTFVPVVGQGLSFWLWGRVLEGKQVWKCYQIIFWQSHVPSINLTEQLKINLKLPDYWKASWNRMTSAT